jgi:hypothetical protein
VVILASPPALVWDCILIPTCTTGHRLPDNPDVEVTVLITLPPGYPESEHPPQLQLLDRYIGDFGVDSGLCA